MSGVASFSDNVLCARALLINFGLSNCLLQNGKTRMYFGLTLGQIWLVAVYTNLGSLNAILVHREPRKTAAQRRDLLSLTLTAENSLCRKFVFIIRLESKVMKNIVTSLIVRNQKHF